MLRMGIVLPLVLLCTYLFAQYPFCFVYDDDSDLPSTEVYSLLQDQRGFIWIGCDAGLFRYDGIRYLPYKCATQKSKSVTGLTMSSSGRIYCQNFQSQLFCIENDSLRELLHDHLQIANIAAGTDSTVYVNHSNGIAVYSERDASWKNFVTCAAADSTGRCFTKSACVRTGTEMRFIQHSGIGIIDGNAQQEISIPAFNALPGTCVLTCNEEYTWIFLINGSAYYEEHNAQVTMNPDRALTAQLVNRKITNARVLADGNLWICTYSGMLRMNLQTGSVDVLYPTLSFSDCMIDREGSYWFSTLQSGIMRAPDLHTLAWNPDNSEMTYGKISHITSGDGAVYFSTVNGTIGRIDTATLALEQSDAGYNADIQSLRYTDHSLVYYINGSLKRFINQQHTEVVAQLPPVKCVTPYKEEWLLASSLGLYSYAPDLGTEPYRISGSWCREMILDSTSHSLFVATNSGLLRFPEQNGMWYCMDTLFPGTQVLSVAADETSRNYYALTFDGAVHSFSQTGNDVVAELPAHVQAYKMIVQRGKIYVATNDGLWIHAQAGGEWQNINQLQGLASDNITDLHVYGSYLWLATGNGVVRLPVHQPEPPARGSIYIRTLSSGQHALNDYGNVQLNHDQSLTIEPEVGGMYSSEGRFQWAYRISSHDTAWTYLPGNTRTITVQNIPAGEMKLELKAVDHLGRDSENTVLVSGYVNPPFWKTTWFIVLLMMASALLGFVAFRFRMRSIQRKQEEKIARMQLENELHISQQAALKAQMNPHFIFNVLNSIKGYIYKNDKLKASEYLGDFSDLVRQILDKSSEPYSTLADELSLVEVYIKLEAMLLQKEFSYEIAVSDEADLHHIRIPSLLLQPFVENAFKHGLRHKEGAKRLSIHIFRPDHKTTVIEISDNGIGRQAAAAINELQQKNHQPFATKAIERRVELVNREGANNMRVHITDLFDDDGKPSGTKAEITITSPETE